jgi:hypothetical protein
MRGAPCACIFSRAQGLIMGFMDENAGSAGTPYLKWNGNEGTFADRDGHVFNDNAFGLDVVGIVAGYNKFGGKGVRPERRTGPIYPKDETPARASLGDTDTSKWPVGRFSGQPEDPWTPVIELPLKHQETGEAYILTLSSKTAIGAARDLIAQLRRMPNGHDPVVKLTAGSMKTKFGVRKKPILTIVGKVPTNGAANKPFDDSLDF